MVTLNPEPSRLRKHNVENIAEEISSSLEYGPDKPLSQFVEALGGDLCVVDVWEQGEELGALIAYPDGQFQINLAAHTSARRDRFTVAHELGHLFIHYLRELDDLPNHERFVATRYGSNRVEWEANWFASAFLMPTPKFTDVFKESGGNIFQIADHFKVSEQAATIRAENLGLIV